VQLEQVLQEQVEQPVIKDQQDCQVLAVQFLVPQEQVD
jgi:hypothetical protein